MAETQKQLCSLLTAMRNQRPDRDKRGISHGLPLKTDYSVAGRLS
jgi:hypothetical protein